MTKAMRIRIARKYLRERAKRHQMTNLSYRPLYHYGNMVKLTTRDLGVMYVEHVEGTSADTAIAMVWTNKQMVSVPESHLRHVTFAEFMWHVDPKTGRRKMGRGLAWMVIPAFIIMLLAIRYGIQMIGLGDVTDGIFSICFGVLCLTMYYLAYHLDYHKSQL